MYVCVCVLSIFVDVIVLGMLDVVLFKSYFQMC